MYDLRRDTEFLDGEIVGLAWDPSNETLWCTDARPDACSRSASRPARRASRSR
jgi:hypothetical protein